MKYENYLDLSGDGGIEGFIISRSKIFILFDNAYWYEYDNIKPGKEHLTHMKDFARKGKGLKTYVNQNVRDNYRSKFKELPPAVFAKLNPPLPVILINKKASHF